MESPRDGGPRQAAGGGFFSRLRRRLDALVGRPGAKPKTTWDQATMALAGHAKKLFSVLPREPEESEALPSQGFAVHLAQALRDLSEYPQTPPRIGILGGGGTGKSTLFNGILGVDLSRTDILPHTTKGPLVVAPAGTPVQGLFHPLDSIPIAPEEVGLRGEPDQVRVVVGLSGSELGYTWVDLPDLNTLGATREGCLTDQLLPWFDALLLVFSVESFDRTILDRSLAFLPGLGTEVFLVFNRKGCRGPLKAKDQEDLEARAKDLKAGGPFYLPDLREKDPEVDGREALKKALAAYRPDRARRRLSLAQALQEVSTLALARHRSRAKTAQEVLDRFRKKLEGLSDRIALDPVTVLPESLAEALGDLRGVVGSPFEFLRRVVRGEAKLEAFRRTFSLERRVEILDQVVRELRNFDPEAYLPRYQDHFRLVSSRLVQEYGLLVEERADLFLEREDDVDLVALVLEPQREALRRGFLTYRDRTLEYLEMLRERLLGPSKLEQILAGAVFAFLLVDLFMPGFSYVTYSAGYLVLRSLGPEFQHLIQAHRDLRRAQRQDLDPVFQRLARELEVLFLEGDRFLGRLDVLSDEVLERLEAATLTLGDPSQRPDLSAPTPERTRD